MTLYTALVAALTALVDSATTTAAEGCFITTHAPDAVLAVLDIARRPEWDVVWSDGPEWVEAFATVEDGRVIFMEIDDGIPAFTISPAAAPDLTDAPTWGPLI